MSTANVVSSKHILSAANVKGGEVRAAHSAVEHGLCVALHGSFRSQSNGFKSAGETKFLVHAHVWRTC